MEKIGKSNPIELSIETEFGPPLYSPKLSSRNEIINYDQIGFTIDKFIRGYEGGSNRKKTQIKYYKIKRFIWDKIESKNKFEFNIILDFSDRVNIKIYKQNNDKEEFIETDNFEIISGVSIVTPYIDLTFKDKEVLPFSTYRYELSVINEKGLESEYSHINIDSLALDFLSEVNLPELSKSITLHETDANYLNITYSLPVQNDPNILHYQKYNNIFTPTKTSYSFYLNYDENNNPIYQIGIIDFGLSFKISKKNQERDFKFLYNMFTLHEFEYCEELIISWLESPKMWYELSPHHKNKCMKLLQQNILYCKNMDLDFFYSIAELFNKNNLHLNKEFNKFKLISFRLV